jgi:hypothetical protein
VVFCYTGVILGKKMMMTIMMILVIDEDHHHLHHDLQIFDVMIIKINK